MTTGVNKLECMQLNFAAPWVRRSFLCIAYNFPYALQLLKFTHSQAGKHNLDGFVFIYVCVRSKFCPSLIGNMSVRFPSQNMNEKHQPNKMHKILLIRLYFPLDALHVSGYVSPSSGATFISYTSHLVYAGICRYHMSGYCVAIATQQPDVPAYTKCDVQLIKLLLMMD